MPVVSPPSTTSPCPSPTVSSSRCSGPPAAARPRCYGPSSRLPGGKDVTKLPPGKRDVAMVFQDYALFPHMDVTDNISYPLRIQKMAKAERREKAATTGAGLGLEK